MLQNKYPYRLTKQMHMRICSNQITVQLEILQLLFASHWEHCEVLFNNTKSKYKNPRGTVQIQHYN